MLYTYFSSRLRELGYISLHIGRETPDLQKLAVKMLVKGYGIVEERREGIVVKESDGIKLLKSKGSEKSDCIYRKGGKNIIPDPPQYPKVVVDLGLFNALDEEEKKKTITQLFMTLNVVRKFWWDGNMVVVGDMKVGKAVTTSSFKSDAPTIVLDPYGDVEADEKIIRGADVFILGGIVDKGRRLKFATSELARKRGYDYPRVKIKLRGSTVGVPDEFNKIAEVVLRVKEGEGLEDAVISVMSKADKVARILHDVNLRGVEVLPEEFKWLKADDKVVNMVKSKLNKL
ncbi:tRNA methyltransferase [Stygiolobus caldivivus]|uniref:tRNA methyltransferase n=1 Tax=Stygiolobus caldivivus TaxID=2824673 RepID=A0A8D5ZJH8_9CREN|nr:tRNA methyltransferase [Stygiolobus caldivivus]BCU70187.1 tRNA methyltransferase [Stygiolobus caldivivus]